MTFANQQAAAAENTSPRRGGSNAGAVAGGVIGGVIAIVVIIWLVWKYCIKKRQDFVEDEWTEEQEEAEKQEQFSMRRDARASTHTVGSIASTVLTRASNVIQIAYIPGVTNRSPPSTPGLLVPPVPPLPFGSSTNSTASSPNYQQDQHFFMPDLRDSTYAAGHDPRAVSPRDSVTPSLGRSSVATTIYRNNAVVDPLPAQTVIRGKAAVVSVKSSNHNSPTDSRPSTPPLPSSSQRNLTPGPSDASRHQPPSPAFSVGSTFLNSTANTAKAMTARPVIVKKTSKGDGAGPLVGSARAAASYQQDLPRMSLATSNSSGSRHSRARRNLSAFEDISSEDEEEPGSRARQSLKGPGRESTLTVIEDSPTTNQSPFSDRMTSTSPRAGYPRGATRDGSSRTLKPQRSLSSGRSTGLGHKPSGSLSEIIEEATRRASRQPTHGGLGSGPRDVSPFSDANEVRDH
ncbi:MAG: hypothetical protein M1817_004379 [Caeruleum heppii]|nr:MAG: hypothetical protein M1817_004379 [Caeruleum heppii]